MFWYYVLGETGAGRPLFCVVIEFPGGKAYPVTAREMTTKEKNRCARVQWRIIARQMQSMQPCSAGTA